MAIVVEGSALAAVQAAAAFPPNPERPMNATTCKEALDRVREAGTGSPRVSAERNHELFLIAMEVAERLCVPASKDGNPD